MAEDNELHSDSYGKAIWKQFRRNPVAVIALGVVIFFCVIAIYAPLLASSHPLAVKYEGQWYFPLFRYLFYTGFFTKRLDIFFNLLIFSFPLLLACWIVGRRWAYQAMGVISLLHLTLFIYIVMTPARDPASDPHLNLQRQHAIQEEHHQEGDPLLHHFTADGDWKFELQFMPTYAKLNEVLQHRHYKEQDRVLSEHAELYVEKLKASDTTTQLTPPTTLPTLYAVDRANREHLISTQRRAMKKQLNEYEQAIANLPELMAAYRPYSIDIKSAKKRWHRTTREVEALQEEFGEAFKQPGTSEYNRIVEAQEEAQRANAHYHKVLKESAHARLPLQEAQNIITRYEEAREKIRYEQQRLAWLEQQNTHVSFEVMPLIRAFHWEDDAGGEQQINQFVNWWQLTRTNHKDLVASLIFGTRVSLVVGITAVLLQLLISLPIGSLAGYFGGKVDIAVSRLLEIWEGVPTFFILLLVVAITQSKSIFLVVLIIGVFGWTGFSRFIRGEVLKQRNLPYVDACRSMGYSRRRIIFSHILPNAIPPVLTLLPFAIMGAITAEAGLSFLGLGEEGSCSWGVLMDEGRQAFPGESYLLWPPAIMLTTLLIAIALVGDGLRDAFDPKMRS